MVVYGFYEIRATNYAHPEITRGQHTNGPATIWVKYKCGEWINTGEVSWYKVKENIKQGKYGPI